MSLQTGRSQHSYTFDVDTELKVSAAVTATGAEALIVDLGTDVYSEFDWVVDVATMERGTADEIYDLVLQFSSSATFASDVVPGPVLHFGEELGTGGTADADALGGRMVVRASNERLGVLRRYVRIANVVAGAASPSITYGAFLSKL